MQDDHVQQALSSLAIDLDSEKIMSPKLYEKLVTAVRLLMGADFFISGLNWWVKLITIYPSISDGVDKLPPGDYLVRAMINTGILFHMVKGVELVVGLALLTNRFVPLALVAALPVALNIFIAVFNIHKLRAYTMGTGALLMNVFLMAAYFEHYRSMLTMKSAPDALESSGSTLQLRPLHPVMAALLRTVRPVLAVVAVVLGAIMITWVAVMVVQHFSD